MSSLVEKLVHDAIEEYERLATENKKLAEALRAEWTALNRPVDRSVGQPVDVDGWIKWGGGDCPVDRHAVVEVRFRDGDTDHYSEAGVWPWRRANHSKDIVAYRVVS